MLCNLIGRMKGLRRTQKRHRDISTRLETVAIYAELYRDFAYRFHKDVEAVFVLPAIKFAVKKKGGCCGEREHFERSDDSGVSADAFIFPGDTDVSFLAGAVRRF